MMNCLSNIRLKMLDMTMRMAYQQVPPGDYNLLAQVFTLGQLGDKYEQQAD